MIIVLGSDRILGRYVYDYLKFKCEYSVVGITEATLDITSVRKTKDVLEYLIKPYDVVINCTKIKSSESDFECTMFMVNSIFPHLVDRICNRKGAHFIQPSSAHIFNGEHGNYQLRDDRDAEDSYGLSEGIGECVYGSVIRISVIGDELVDMCKNAGNDTGKNSGKDVISPINGYDNKYLNPITCLEWVKLVDRIIREEDWWSGIRVYQSRFNGRKCMCETELLQIISDIYDLDIKIHPTELKNKIDIRLCGKILDEDLRDQLVDLHGYEFTNKPLDLIKIDKEYVYDSYYAQEIKLTDDNLYRDVFTEMTELPEEDFNISDLGIKSYSDKYSLPPKCEEMWNYLNCDSFISQLSKLVDMQLYTDETRLWTHIIKFRPETDVCNSTIEVVSPITGTEKKVSVHIYFSKKDGETSILSNLVVSSHVDKLIPHKENYDHDSEIHCISVSYMSKK